MITGTVVGADSLPELSRAVATNWFAPGLSETVIEKLVIPPESCKAPTAEPLTPPGAWNTCTSEFGDAVPWIW